VLSCKLGSAVDRLSHDQDLGKGICQDDVDADFSTLDSVWRAPMLLERPAQDEAFTPMKLANFSTLDSVWRAPMLLKRPAEDEDFTPLKLANFSTLDSVWRAPMLLKRIAEDEDFTPLKLPRTAGTRR